MHAEPRRALSKFVLPALRERHTMKRLPRMKRSLLLFARQLLAPPLLAPLLLAPLLLSCGEREEERPTT